MKTKHLILAMFALITMVGCIKEGDFSELRHPLIVEGEFDPVLGFPLAKMSADMGDLVKMLDSSQNLSLYVNDNDLISLRYSEIQHVNLDFTMGKGVQAADGSLMVYRTTELNGSVPISLFSRIEQLSEHNISAASIIVTMDADMKGYVKDSLLAMVDRGAIIDFDSIRMQVKCADGHTEPLPLADTSKTINISRLVNGVILHIVDHYDMHDLLERRPTELRYSLRMNMAIPADQLADDALGRYIDSLGIDSIAATIQTNVDIPMQMYCEDLTYSDTIELNLQQMDTLLNQVEDYMTLRDSLSYFVIEASNYIPLEMKINGMLMDANYNVLQDKLFDTDSALVGAPVKKHGQLDLYESDGYSQSRLVLPIGWTMLRKLSRTKYMKFMISASSSTRGAQEAKPKVAVKKDDRLDLRAYVVVAPHVSLSVPVSIINK